MVGPWVYRLATDLTAERAERVRTQERADLAAHLHDSVLQTLALIQKNAGDGAVVARLARSQERDLRAWLFDGESADDGHRGRGAAPAAAAGSRTPTASPSSWSPSATATSTRSCAPIVAAAREAVANAAKHAGTGRVDVYAEVSPDAVEVFVRDRGRGFDPDDLPADRHGVRHSILDRMRRHGGTAEIRSAPGEGTEVRLHLPRGGTRPTTGGPT